MTRRINSGAKQNGDSSLLIRCYDGLGTLRYTTGWTVLLSSSGSWCVWCLKRTLHHKRFHCYHVFPPGEHLSCPESPVRQRQRQFYNSKIAMSTFASQELTQMNHSEADIQIAKNAINRIERSIEARSDTVSQQLRTVQMNFMVVGEGSREHGTFWHAWT